MNIINAIYNLVNSSTIELKNYCKKKNSANNKGEALEEYVKDLFANSFGLNDEERDKKLKEAFSYLGNDNNPPDIMLKSGDAIEVKKIEAEGATLAFNSSYPKQVLCKNDLMITSTCQKAEQWDKKDMLYIVGVVGKENNLKHLAMVYGLDYCASKETYEVIKQTIKNGVESIPEVEFSETRELGRIKKIDALNIAQLRIRPMWVVKNPWKAFDYVYQRDENKSFTFMSIINKKKWNTFPNAFLLEEINKHNFKIEDIKIKNPDNPTQFVEAKLISFSY